MTSKKEDIKMHLLEFKNLNRIQFQQPNLAISDT